MRYRVRTERRTRVGERLCSAATPRFDHYTGRQRLHAAAAHHGTPPAALVFRARDTVVASTFYLTRGVYRLSGANVPAVSRVLPQGLDRYATGIAQSVLPYDNPSTQKSCNPIFDWSDARSGQLLTGSGAVAGSNWWLVVIGTSSSQREPLRTTSLNMNVTGDNAVGTMVYKYRLDSYCGTGVEEQNPWYITATFTATFTAAFTATFTATRTKLAGTTVRSRACTAATARGSESESKRRTQVSNSGPDRSRHRTRQRGFAASRPQR